MRGRGVQGAQCLLSVPHQVWQTPRAGEWGPRQAHCGREDGAEEVSLTVLWWLWWQLFGRDVLSQQCSWACGGARGFLLAPDPLCLCFPPCCSTISSILGAWLDQYSEDFRKPPDFACLKQLISYVRHNIPGSDLERRARILLAQFQQQEQSEAEAEGGVLPPLVGSFGAAGGGNAAGWHRGSPEFKPRG